MAGLGDVVLRGFWDSPELSVELSDSQAGFAGLTDRENSIEIAIAESEAEVVHLVCLLAAPGVMSVRKME